MRRITLPECPALAEMDESFDPIAMVRVILNTPKGGRGAGGMDLEEIRRSLKVGDALEEAEQRGDLTILLEDDYWSLLVAKVERHQFGAIHPEIVEFCDAIINAPEHSADVSELGRTEAEG